MGKTTRIIFRAMTVDDADSAAELDLKCFGERDAWSGGYFFYAARDEQSIYIVGEANGKIIACAGAEIYRDAAELETFAVDTGYRRLGVGTKLFGELIDALKIRGATVIYLEVRPSNTAAINFYEAHGFKIVDRVKNFYIDEDAWVMLREL